MATPCRPVGMCKKLGPWEYKAPNKAPTAIAGPDQVITLPTDSASLDGTSSSDPYGTISEWLWTKISGPASFTTIDSGWTKTAMRNLSTGIYQFELKVTVDDGLYDDMHQLFR